MKNIIYIFLLNIIMIFSPVDVFAKIADNIQRMHRLEYITKLSGEKIIITVQQKMELVNGIPQLKHTTLYIASAKNNAKKIACAEIPVVQGMEDDVQLIYLEGITELDNGDIIIKTNRGSYRVELETLGKLISLKE